MKKQNKPVVATSLVRFALDALSPPCHAFDVRQRIMKRLLAIVIGFCLVGYGTHLCMISAHRASLPQDPSSGHYWDEGEGVAYNDSSLFLHAIAGIPLILGGVLLPCAAFGLSRLARKRSP